MINNVISVIADKLNESLGNRFSQSGELIVPASLNNLDDENNSETQNKLLLTVANIEQERLSKTSPSRAINRPINVYLYLLLSSNFQKSNYEEGLKLLSAAISFFQYHSVFNHNNTPDLDHSVEKLVFEMINLNIQELSQLWGVHGGKYLPSILYKARMVTISEDVIEQTFNIAGFGSDVAF